MKVLNYIKNDIYRVICSGANVASQPKDEEKFLKKYGTSGRDIFSKVVNKIEAYNRSHSTKLVASIKDGKVVIENSSDLSIRELENIISGAYDGWEPVVDGPRGSGSNLVISLSACQESLQAPQGCSRKPPPFCNPRRFGTPISSEIPSRLGTREAMIRDLLALERKRKSFYEFLEKKRMENEYYSSSQCLNNPQTLDYSSFVLYDKLSFSQDEYIPFVELMGFLEEKGTVVSTSHNHFVFTDQKNGAYTFHLNKTSDNAVLTVSCTSAHESQYELKERFMKLIGGSAAESNLFKINEYYDAEVNAKRIRDNCVETSLPVLNGSIENLSDDCVLIFPDTHGNIEKYEGIIGVRVFISPFIL